MTHLTREQRYTIAAMHKRGYKQKEIAAAIGKDKSVVSRELRRGANDKGAYSFTHAQMCADVRKERLRLRRKFTPGMLRLIEERVGRMRWSPEQLVGHCRANGVPMVCVEMVYRHIREDRLRGGRLFESCRHQLKHRRRPVGRWTPIKDRVPIAERPPEADGSRFGDWEMDTIVGRDGKGAMLTLVERSQGFSIITKLPRGKDADGVLEAAYRELLPYRASVLTITTDNGPEFARHKELARRLGASVFFADPYCSWQKGLIEYTNKLYRQYIPKKADFCTFSEEQVKQIQHAVNARPRKKLGFKAPVQTFFKLLR